MSDDDIRWAEQLLARTRNVAGPREDDAARNLASIEERLGIVLPTGPAAMPGIEARGSATPIAASRELGPPGELLGLRLNPRGTAPFAKPAGLPLAVKVGLVLSFGLLTGVLGYLIGRAETQPNRERTAVDVLPGLPLAVPPPEPVRSAPIDSSDTRTPGAAASALGSVEVRPTKPALTGTVGGAHAPSSERRQRTSAVSSARAVPSRAAPRAASKADVFDLSEALELLRRAEAAVRRSDGLEARMWLTDLDRRAPRNVLVEERLVTQTLADCLLGEVESARATLRELEASNSESIYRARLEGSCVAERMLER